MALRLIGGAIGTRWDPVDAMSTSCAKTQSVGFVTVVEGEDQTLFGGYLVLNFAGRPLEFHCTAPVKANRAQQILYGPTLRPYLCGELIAQTLITKAKVVPALVCTNTGDVVAVREFVSMPVVYVSSPAAMASSVSMTTFEIESSRFGVFSSQLSDQSAFEKYWAELTERLDLLEPFERIREAVEEAQRTAARRAQSTAA